MAISAKLAGLALIMSVSLATPAFADTICGGDAPVQRVLTYSDGSVLLLTSWRNDYLQICNLNSTWKGVSTGTCFAWMSQISSALAFNKPTGFYYAGVDATFCKSAPTYGNAPVPVYIYVAP
jgi:hypothetical protein